MFNYGVRVWFWPTLVFSHTPALLTSQDAARVCVLSFIALSLAPIVATTQQLNPCSAVCSEPASGQKWQAGAPDGAAGEEVGFVCVRVCIC
jgi:hypothetical protein